MHITTKDPFRFILCFLIALFAFQCLSLIEPNQIVFAEEDTGTQKIKSPSFTVKGANITAVQQESVEKQSGKTATGDQPGLSIESPSHNVGEVWEGNDIIHPFIVKNTGTAQLDIKNVKAG